MREMSHADTIGMKGVFDRCKNSIFLGNALASSFLLKFCKGPLKCLIFNSLPLLSALSETHHRQLVRQGSILSPGL